MSLLTSRYSLLLAGLIISIFLWREGKKLTFLCSCIEFVMIKFLDFELNRLMWDYLLYLYLGRKSDCNGRLFFNLFPNVSTLIPWGHFFSWIWSNGRHGVVYVTTVHDFVSELRQIVKRILFRKWNMDVCYCFGVVFQLSHDAFVHDFFLIIKKIFHVSEKLRWFSIS